jgi:hypothetical protein
VPFTWLEKADMAIKGFATFLLAISAPSATLANPS